MRFHDSLPSRIYSYSAREPVAGLDTVLEQLSLSHRYYNALVENKRAEYDAIEAARAELFPELVQTQDEVDAIDAQIDELRTRINQARAAARRRVVDREANAAITALRAQKRPLWERLKEIRAQAKESCQLKEKWSNINAEYNERRKALRESCGVYNGTYMQVEKSVQAAGVRPHFKRWTGEGKLSVQIQSTRPLTPAVAHLCTDSRLRVTPVDHTQPYRQRKSVVWLRVHSDGPGGKRGQPVWAQIPILLHRPLPDGCQIKWAWLIRYRVATHYKWKLQFVVSQQEWVREDAAADGVVGVDVGWRVVDAGLRVAVWAGSDGRTGELVIPTDRLSGWDKVESLQSIRDRMFDEIKPKLGAFLANAKDHNVTVPDWLRERTEHLAQWRSTARLASVVLFWRDNRFEGDHETFQILESWRRQDRHLYDWQENQRTKLQRWRDHEFKNVAAQLRRQYQTVRLEKINWAELQKSPQPEDNPSGVPVLYRRAAAVGRLCEVLQQGITRTEYVGAAHTTDTCHECKQLCVWNRADLVHCCEHCGATWDQDENAARNVRDTEPVDEDEATAVA